MTNSALPDLRLPADHGGGIDAAAARFGGRREDWVDLSTGINPHAYPLPEFAARDWTALPDRAAADALERAARAFWHVPEAAGFLAAPGLSALIARVPALASPGRVAIPGPTYNEHARAFLACGWSVDDTGRDARVIVHPNNPDGRLRGADSDAAMTVIDESFCDVMPEASLMPQATRPGTLILKSFGKFWGLAGLRLGFAIGDPALVEGLRRMTGPWPVSGPALRVGAMALADQTWADQTRQRLHAGAARLDGLMTARSARLAGGTPLFRLYEVPDAAHWQEVLARRMIWTRTFPYDPRWLRLGMPGASDWDRLKQALEDCG